MKKKYVPAIVLIFIGFILYAGTLKNPYVWDDGLFIQNSNFIKRWQNTFVFFSPKNYFKYTQDLTYRPLPYLVHILNYKIFNINPVGHRLANIFLHIAVAVLLYFLVLHILSFLSEGLHNISIRETSTGVLAKARDISKNNLIAFFSALFFVIHPANNEVVNMVSFNETQLSTMFFLGSFFCYIKSKNILSVIFYSLALFSKEVAVTLFAVVILYDIIFERKLHLKRYIPFICAAGFYLFVRFFVFRHPTEPMIKYPGDSFFVNILTMLKAVPVYLSMVFFPFNLNVEHRIIIPHSFFEPQVIFGFLAAAVFLASLVFAFKKSKPVFFLLLFTALTFLPTSNIIPMQNIVAERYLYLPIIGLCVILALFLEKIGRARLSVSYGAAICIFVFFAIIVFTRNRDWKGDFTFYAKTLKQNPDSPGAHINIGMMYKTKKDYEKALETVNYALKIDPKYLDGKTALGSIYHEMGDYDRAFEVYKEIAERRHYQYNKAPFMNLGIIYKIRKQYGESLKNFGKAIEINPLSAASYAYIAEIYELHGKFDEAQKYYEKSADINPDDHIPLNALGIIYGQKNKYDESLRCLKKALKLKPDSADIHFNLGYLYFLYYQYGESLREMEAALKLDPDNERAKYIISQISGKNKK